MYADQPVARTRIYVHYHDYGLAGSRFLPWPSSGETLELRGSSRPVNYNQCLQLHGQQHIACIYLINTMWDTVQCCIVDCGSRNVRTVWAYSMSILFISGFGILHSETQCYIYIIPSMYSGPCDLRPLYLTIPCILRLDISDTTSIFSV